MSRAAGTTRRRRRRRTNKWALINQFTVINLCFTRRSGEHLERPPQRIHLCFSFFGAASAARSHSDRRTDRRTDGELEKIDTRLAARFSTAAAAQAHEKWPPNLSERNQCRLRAAQLALARCLSIRQLPSLARSLAGYLFRAAAAFAAQHNTLALNFECVVCVCVCAFV